MDLVGDGHRQRNSVLQFGSFSFGIWLLGFGDLGGDGLLESRFLGILLEMAAAIGIWSCDLGLIVVKGDLT